ncbi:MAG: MXAN_5187 family protein [Polyangiaceae bacterium]
MILSRFWYAVLALAFGAAVFILLLAVQMYNRAGNRAMSESLLADSSAVEWYLKDDARRRASALIQMSLDPKLRANLAKSSGESRVPKELHGKNKEIIDNLLKEVPADLKFDAVWAVDASGRVVGAHDEVTGANNEEWELGGFPLVADALHGWIRDDAWVFKERIYRVVARPVEMEVGGQPVGAIIGAKIVNDEFARAVSKRTGAAVGFYAANQRVASGAPEGFDKSNLDSITQDLKFLEGNKDYEEKGRSDVRILNETLGVVYARLPGEAWDLGAGYAVGRLSVRVDGPLDFMSKADNTDKGSVTKSPTFFGAIGAVVLALVLGLFFSFMEHTKPLRTFAAQTIELAKGKIDVLAPSKFSGAYKKIAADINDGMEKIAEKGGVPRKAANLEKVLGPMPSQPAMSAFALPGEPAPPSGPVSAQVISPTQSSGPRGLPKAPPRGPVSTPKPAEPEELEEVSEVASAKPKPPPPKRPGAPPAPPAPAPPSAAAEPSVAEASNIQPIAQLTGEEPFDEMADWRRVYEEFLALKQQCGEPTSNLTFEKFKGTLQRNKDALVARHNCARVKFTVYVKEGKAALKASPVK